MILKYRNDELGIEAVGDEEILHHIEARYTEDGELIQLPQFYFEIPAFIRKGLRPSV